MVVTAQSCCYFLTFLQLLLVFLNYLQLLGGTALYPLLVLILDLFIAQSQDFQLFLVRNIIFFHLHQEPLLLLLLLLCQYFKSNHFLLKPVDYRFSLAFLTLLLLLKSQLLCLEHVQLNFYIIEQSLCLYNSLVLLSQLVPEC